MAEKTTTTKIRAAKDQVFDILKSQAPSLFGTKVWADAKFFGEDPADTSKLVIEFNEE